MDLRFFLAGLTLFLFVITAALGGFFVSVAVGFYSLAGACLVATYFLGASE